MNFDVFTPRAYLTFAGHPASGTAVYVASNPSIYTSVQKMKTLIGTIPFEYEDLCKRVSVDVPHAFRLHQKRLPLPLPSIETGADGSEAVPLIRIVKSMVFYLVSCPLWKTLGCPEGIAVK